MGTRTLRERGTPTFPIVPGAFRQFRGLPGGQCFGGKLAESYGKLQDDEALKHWLDTDVLREPGSC